MTEQDLNSPDENILRESGWEGHEAAQLRRMARLTLEQKSRWLQSAQEMVKKMELSRHNNTQQFPEQEPSKNSAETQ